MPWWDVFTHGPEAAVDAIGDGVKKVANATVDVGKDLANTAAGLVTGDTYFPDNPKRQARAEELGRDCTDLAGALSVTTAGIDTGLKNINAKVGSAFATAVQRPKDPFSIAAFTVQTKQYETQQVLLPLVTSSAAAPALLLGTMALLSKEGVLPAGVLEAALAVTGLYSISLAADAGPAGIAIVLGIGAATGAQRRDDLQSAIHKGIAARNQLAHALVVNGKLADGLTAIGTALDVLIESGAPEDRVVGVMTDMSQKQTAAITASSDADTAQLLAAKDRLHGSWTNEDN